MVNKASNNIQQELDKLKQAYIRRLHSSVAELRRMQVILASSVQLPVNDLQNLYKLSNNLMGSGTTYGFPKISQTAQALNQSLKAYLDIGQTSADNVLLRRNALYQLEIFQSACMEALTPRIAVSSENTTALIDLTNKRVAVVSADETMGELCAHVLQQRLMNVQAMSLLDARGGIDVLRQKNLVIIDTGEKAAFDLVSKLRGQGSIVSIILLIDKMDINHSDVVSGQVDDFIIKPFGPAILATVVANRLAQVRKKD